ncbi:hypothetical protein AALF85_05575 [Jeotgalicoccus halotolerans]|uniref:hypothetical protein n=1 Tax=Jeotgalicoccus halotolerans TaxID=157227 RepID=UPI0035156761
MSLIVFLLSSGLPGLYSYIHLSSLSVIGEEDSLMKKLYLTTFSFVSVLFFTLIYALLSWSFEVNTLFDSINLWRVLASLVITLIIVYVFNTYIYRKIINVFRKNINKIRNEKGFTKSIQMSPINKILDDENNIIYIERIDNETNEVYSSGTLKYYSIDNNQNLIIVLKEQNKRLDINKDDIKKNIVEKILYFDAGNSINLRIIKLKKI